MKAKKKLLRTIALLLVSVMLFQNGLSSAYAMENQLVGSTDGNLEPVNLGDGQDGVDPNGNKAQPVNTQDGSDNNSSTKASGNDTSTTSTGEGEADGKSTPTGGDDASITPTGEGEADGKSTPTGGKDASTAPAGEGENESTPTGEKDASTAPTGEGENESTPTGGSDASVAPAGEGENANTPTGGNDASTPTDEEDSQEPEGNAEPLMMKRSMARGVQRAAGIGQWGESHDSEGTHVIVGWFEEKETDKENRPSTVPVTVYWQTKDGVTHTGTVTLCGDGTDTNVSKTDRNLGAYTDNKTISIDRWKTWPNYDGGVEDQLRVTYDFPDIPGYKKQGDGDCGVIYIKSDTELDGTGKIIIKKKTVIPNGAEITTPAETVFRVTNFDTNEVKEIPYSAFKPEGEYMSYTLEEMPLGFYKITESGAEQDGYVLKVTGSKAGHNDISDENKYETNNGPEASVIINEKNGADIAYITNTYEDANTYIQFEAKKHLDGTLYNGEAGKFTFVVKEGNVEVTRATNDENGSIKFPKIYYNTARTHNYTISEVKGTSPNIKYDTTSYNVTVKVEQNADETLKVTADYDKTAEIVFKNYTLVDIPVTKTWDDNENQDGKRPESITVRLHANGEEKQVNTVKSVDNWECTFTGLPEYDENGQKINYTVSEDAVEGYTTKIDGCNITNSYTPEKTSVSGTKTWDDNDNQDGKRPESITVNLLVNGDSVDSTTVSEDENGNWEYSFTNLPKYENGQEIVYTVSENPVDGYQSEISGDATAGFVIKNSHTPEKTSVSGTKTWDDNNNQAGKRPESITINLLADGKEVKKQTVKADKKGKWSYSFTDLDKYKAGKEIKYTITEDPVEGYTTKIDGYNVTNSYIPEKPGNPQDGDKPMNPGTKPSGDKPTNPDTKPSGDKPTNPDTKPSGDKTTNASKKPSGNKPTVDSATTPVKSVRTGDNSAIGFWLASTAALAVVLCVLLRKKLNR